MSDNPTTPDERRVCAGVTKAGTACGMSPMADVDFCWSHDPATTPEAKRAALSRGADNANALRTLDAATVVDAVPLSDTMSIPAIRRFLTRLAKKTASGAIPPARAKAVATVMTVLLRAVDLEVAGRLDALEAMTKQLEAEGTIARRPRRR